MARTSANNRVSRHTQCAFRDTLQSHFSFIISFIFSGSRLARRLHILRAQAIWKTNSKGDAMKTWMASTLVKTAITAIFVASQANAQDAVKRVIVVSLEDHKLALVEDGQVKKVYTVAVGKPSTPSPVGIFTIERRVANPTYQHNGKIVLPGPHNPVGTRWMGLSKHGYGIHGTNEPNSIGKSASHGCIRLSRGDLEELYSLVSVGDTVELVGQRNAETAQLFGTGEGPAETTQTTLVATAATQAPAQAIAQAPDSAPNSTAASNLPAPAVAAIVASR
jgi:lipoprotein-anchoring transpeptidase ErfK/SrfK